MEQKKKSDSRISYSVFPGVTLVYNAIHSEYCPAFTAKGKHTIVIQHCREGRMEQKCANEYFYLMPGDLSISMQANMQDECYFPFKHYHGITIMIDTDLTPKCFSCFLKGVDVSPEMLIDKFCNNRECFVIRSKDYIRHIFSELYDVPEEIRKGYFKIKILELLLFLKTVDTNNDESQQRLATPSQAQLAKHVSKYLLSRMDEKVTLKQLSDIFHISEANIKNAFKTVYGVPVYAFVKTQKMESASYMLEYTDKSILEIAGEHGYDNGSKFASAFRDVKGVCPKEYRSIHHQI